MSVTIEFKFLIGAIVTHVCQQQNVSSRDWPLADREVRYFIVERCAQQAFSDDGWNIYYHVRPVLRSGTAHPRENQGDFLRLNEIELVASEPFQSEKPDAPTP